MFSMPAMVAVSSTYRGLRLGGALGVLLRGVVRCQWVTKLHACA
jgi:hypothetical protein